MVGDSVHDAVNRMQRRSVLFPQAIRTCARSRGASPATPDAECRPLTLSWIAPGVLRVRAHHRGARAGDDITSHPVDAQCTSWPPTSPRGGPSLRGRLVLGDGRAVRWRPWSAARCRRSAVLACRHFISRGPARAVRRFVICAEGESSAREGQRPVRPQRTSSDPARPGTAARAPPARRGSSSVLIPLCVLSLGT